MDESNDQKLKDSNYISVISITTLVIFLMLFSVSVNVVVKDADFLSAVLPSVLVDLTNEARVENNYQALKISEELTFAAKMKADHLAQNEYFSHVSPDGLTPWYWIGLSGYQFIYAGENLAVGFSASQEVNEAWLDSPGHAANILNANFTEIGIATARGEYDGEDTIFVVQMFGTPAPVVETLPPAPIEPEVKEVQVVVVEEQVVSEDELSVVFQNEEFEMEPIEDPGTVGQAEAPGFEKYSTWYDRLLLNPARLTEYALYAAVFVIISGLLLSISNRNSRRNPKGLIYGVFILLVLLIAIYLNRAGLITENILEHFR